MGRLVLLAFLLALLLDFLLDFGGVIYELGFVRAPCGIDVAD